MDADDNADGRNVSSSARTLERVDGTVNKIHTTYESNKHDGQEFEGNEFTYIYIVMYDNAE